jgi:hypothetical protein
MTIFKGFWVFGGSMKGRVQLSFSKVVHAGHNTTICVLPTFAKLCLIEGSAIRRTTGTTFNHYDHPVLLAVRSVIVFS